MVQTAERAAAEGRVTPVFAAKKRATASFFMAKLLPKVQLLKTTLEAGSEPVMAASF